MDRKDHACHHGLGIRHVRDDPLVHKVRMDHRGRDDL